MAYKVKLTEYAQKDFDDLDGSVKKEAAKALRKLATSPEYGMMLGNKHGINLSGCYKLYFNDRKNRIVYTLFTIEEESGEQIVRVVAIGPRDDLEVYKTVADRILKGQI